MSWWQQDTPSGDTANLDRFLSFLKKAEGGEPDIIVGGGRFSDFSQHPRVVGLRTKEGPSTAAGNYQITASTYDDVAPKIGVTGFTPADQRAIAVELIRRKGALEDINGGDFTSAINKLGSTWASLPSSPYSQPKKSWDETNKMLGTQVASAKPSENWWSKDTPVNDAGAQSNWWSGDTPVDAPAAAVGGPQPAPSPVVQAAPQVAAPVVPKATVNPAAAISTEQPLGERIKRGMSIGTRDVLEGIDKYNPVRAAFDFAGGVAGLVGDKGLPSLFGLPGIPGAAQAREYITNNLGMNAKQTLGSAVSDKAGLAKPETKAEKTVSAAVQGASGLLTGTGLSNVIAKAPQAIQTASSVLLPAVSGTAKQVAGQAALTGGLSASMEVAPAETAAGLALLAAGKAGAGRYATSRGADKLIKNAGNNEGARIDAEVVQDLRKTAGNGNLRDNDLMTNVINDVGNRYVNDVKNAVKRVDPNILKQLDVENVLAGKKSVTPDELFKIQGTPAGDALASAITKFQRLGSITQQAHANGSIPAVAVRGLITAVPAAIGGAVGGIPGAALGGMMGPLASTYAQRLTGKSSRAEVTAKLIKNADSADEVLKRLGNSQASTDISRISDMAQKSVASRAAQVEAAKALAAQKATDNAATKLQVLKDTKRPLSGAFQELLPGGAANLNLSSKEAIDALRLTSRQFKDGPIGNAATEILRSGNVTNKDAFYGLQNQLRKLQEQGVLKGQPGALSEASSGVRNPISYKEAVRTAGEAADLARASAPTKELAQFATTVAGIKAPADKATAIAERLAKTSDPTEAAFLTQFVEPLAQFGKKTKK